MLSGHGRTIAGGVLMALALLAIVGLGGCSDDDGPTGSVSRIVRVPGQMADLETALTEAKVGDTIIVSDGLYTGDGFRDLDFLAKSLTVMSENGPEHCIIDLGGSGDERHYGFSFPTGLYAVLVQGITIRGGFTSMGAALLCSGGVLTFRDMVLVNNVATISGGAIRCKSTGPLFERCTIAYNECLMAGGGVFLIANAAARFENCIVAYNKGGGAFYVSDNGSTPTLVCCDLYQNVDGDWTDKIAAQADQNGNRSIDPWFCSFSGGDFSLQAGSPCSVADGCGQIGAVGVGCAVH